MSEIANILNEFPNFVDGIGSQFHTMPHFEDPVVGAVSTLFIGAAGIMAFKIMKKEAAKEHSKECSNESSQAETKDESTANLNSSKNSSQDFNALTSDQNDTLNASIVSVKKNKGKVLDIVNIGRKTNEDRRLSRPVNLAVTGLALSLGLVIAKPSYEQVESSQSTVAVVSATNSMLYTNDMGHNQSRFTSAIDALKNSNYNGNLGIVTYDHNSVVNAQLSPKTSINFNSINFSNVSHFNPGGNLDSAILDAEQLLVSSNTYKSSKKGEILIISDGTLVSSSTSQEIGSLMSSIKGVNVEIIVPGNTGSTYQLAKGTYAFGSGVKPENLSFNGVNPPTVVNNQTSLNQAVNEDLSKTLNGVTKEKKTWILGELASLMITGASLFILIRDRLKKVDSQINKAIKKG